MPHLLVSTLRIIVTRSAVPVHVRYQIILSRNLATVAIDVASHGRVLVRASVFTDQAHLSTF
jgi:hypothetical protein